MTLLLLTPREKSPLRLFSLFDASDLVVIPAMPFLTDSSDVQSIRNVANAARCPHVTILTRAAHANSKRNRELLTTQSDVVAPVVMRALVAHYESFSRNQCVLETFPNGEAARGVSRLLDDLIDRTNGGANAKTA